MDRGDNPFDPVPVPVVDPPAYTSSSYGDYSKPAPAEKMTSLSIDGPEPTELKALERDIKQKEKELKRKEKEVASMEEAIRNGEGIKNFPFPPWFAIAYHNIKDDIPAHAQRLQTAAFYSWWGLVICLLVNLIVVAAGWIGKVWDRNDRMVAAWFIMIIITLLAVPLSWLRWYKPLYHAVRKDSGFRFLWFFIWYSIHVLFVLFATISPPLYVKKEHFSGYSFAGYVQAFNLLGQHHNIVAIMYLIAAGFWTVETLLSLWVLISVFKYFRGEGKEGQARVAR